MLVANDCLTSAFQIWLIDAKIDKMLVNLSQSINELHFFWKLQQPQHQDLCCLCQVHLVVEMLVSQKWTSSTHVGGIFSKHFIKYFNFLNVQFTSVLTAYLTAIIDFSQLTSILSSLVSIDQILMQVANSCYSLADYKNEINQFLSDIGDDFKFKYLAICFVKSHLKVTALEYAEILTQSPYF